MINPYSQTFPTQPEQINSANEMSRYFLITLKIKEFIYNFQKLLQEYCTVLEEAGFQMHPYI